MESLKQPSARLKVAALMSSIALAGCSMEAGVTPKLSADEGEPLFPIPADCQIEIDDPLFLPEGEHKTIKPKTEKDVREDRDNAHSPMENRKNPLTKVRNAIETMGVFNGEFETRQVFPLRDSGIIVEIRSDASNLYIDERALSDILLMPLDKADLFQQPNLQQQMRCYREAVLEDKKFEGHRLELYIPSDNSLCFTEDLALAPVNVCEARKEKSLDSRYYLGFTPPQIELETPFFTLKQDSQTQLMFLVGAHVDPETAGARADQTLLHEAGHYWWWLNGGPLKISQGLEQPIQEMEAELKKTLKQKGQSMPRAIHYR